MHEGLRYIPPHVSGSKLKEYLDPHKTLKETNLDVGGYIRVSTKKEAQITSIENQRKVLKEWAKVNGYNLAKFYIDVKSGAYSYLRNEMQQLREDIKSGKIKGIIAKEIARTSRDIMDILDLKRSLSDSGAFFISLKENYDSRTDDDEFLLVIHAGLAQKERKTTASRVKVTQLLKAREGKTNVATPAFGYRLSEDKQHLVIDPDRSKIYKFMVEKFLEGWGQLRICKWLNRQGILPSRGKSWHTNSIRSILTNPVYLGITIYNATTLIRDSTGKQKRVVRPNEEWVIRSDTHEPLIILEQFNKIQEIMKKRAESDSREWSGEKKYLLSGYLYCNVCKGKLYGARQPSRAKGGTGYYYYYVDQNRSGLCDTKTKYWDMQKVEKLVMQEISKIFYDRKMIEERIRAKRYLYKKEVSDEKEKHKRLLQEICSINSAVRRQQEAYEKEAISIEEYKVRLGELREQKIELSRRVESLERKLQNNDVIDESFKTIRDRVFYMMHNLNAMDNGLKEAVLARLVKRIYISEDYSISIDYIFN
ncbi:MAG: recombinase family protein [Bacillota bacterium]